MEALRIAVVDDERPARSELIHQLTELLPDAVFREGDCGAAALEITEEEPVDLIFLDINLGDINGTALVGALKKMRPQMKIIFVTAYSEYAVKAFELDVDDYIMKPFHKKRLEKVVSKYTRASEIKRRPDKEETKCPRRLAINVCGKTVFVNIGDVVYIETSNRGCVIHTSDQEYYEGKSIGEFEKKLEHARFFRIHKSYLINLDKVKEMFLWGNNSFALKMEGYEENILPIGRDKTKTLKRLLVGT